VQPTYLPDYFQIKAASLIVSPTRRIERDRARDEEKGEASGGGYARRADAERSNKRHERRRRRRRRRRRSGGDAEDKDVNHNM